MGDSLVRHFSREEVVVTLRHLGMNDVVDVAVDCIAFHEAAKEEVDWKCGVKQQTRLDR